MALRGVGQRGDVTITIDPPHRVPPVIRQLWRVVGFVHWPFDAQDVQRVLPPPLLVDTYDGLAWVSIVCFSTTCQIAGLVPLPGPRTFPETNVRTYVRAPDGSRGLYFFSLDVTNRANVLMGRSAALRYRLADMDIDVDDLWHYRGVRRDGSGSYDIALAPEAGAVDGPLDLYLTARWSAYADVKGRVIRFDVHHQRWPLRGAHLEGCAQSLLPAEGLPQPSAEPRAHVAAGVDANLAPRRIVW